MNRLHLSSTPSPVAAPIAVPAGYVRPSVLAGRPAPGVSAPNVIDANDPLATVVYSRGDYVESVFREGTPHFQFVRLLGLPVGVQELQGELAAVRGRSPLKGQYRHLPFLRAGLMASEGYAQVHLYHTLDTFVRDVAELGIDLPRIFGSRHQGRPHPIVAFANAMDALNAFYSPDDDLLAFGTGDGKMALAACGDVVIHEAGHMILDHQAPGLFGAEGGAIHEGFGDAIATLYYNDSQLAEEFLVAIGRVPDPFQGMREVNNDLTLESAGNEVHARGRVYGGFFWSLRTALADSAGEARLDERAAATLTLKLALAHGFFYNTVRPRAQHFIEAVLGGVGMWAEQDRLEIAPDTLRALIVAEGVRRKMITADEATQLLQPEPAPVSADPALGSQWRFSPLHTVPFLGGRTEYHQLQLYTAQHGHVDLLGHVMVRRYWDDGTTMRSVFSGIDAHLSALAQQMDVEHPCIAYHLALLRALEVARVRVVEARAAVQRLPFDADPVAKAPAQMAVLRAERSLNLLERLAVLHEQGNAEPPRLVIPFGEIELHYQVRLGFETCSIGARSGIPTFSTALYV